jgi:putative selenate reductase
VHQGRPYRDKPRLFLQRSDFDREDENAFYIERGEQGWAIRKRNDGHESTLLLCQDNQRAVFENDVLRIEVSPLDLYVERVQLKEEFEGEFSPSDLGEMLVIVRLATADLSFLPFHRVRPDGQSVDENGIGWT